MKRGQIILLAVGIAAGYWLAKHGSPVHLPRFHRASGGLPKQQEAITPSVKGEIWLDDFEDADINKRWKRRGVVATQSEEHATHGRWSAKVTYDNSEGPSFAMEDYMNDDGRRRNWRGYEQFSFDIFNAQPGQERVILQLKDKDGRAYKEDIVVNGKATQHISVRLEDLKELLNLSRMEQVNLFRWKPNKASAFYVDAMRLEPPAASAKAAPPAKPSTTVKAHWQVGWISSLEKLQRDPAKFTGKMNGPVQMTMAGGEYESVQIVLIGGHDAAKVTVSLSDLTNEKGTARFPSDVVEIRRVGYVTTHEPYYPVTYVGDWPDPLPRISEEGVDIPAEQVQPVWITIGAPPSLPPGKYLGTITIAEKSGRIEHLPLEITVRNFVLSTAPHLKTAFDFYRFRLEKAYREFVPGGAAWQGRMSDLENLYFLDMIKHRIMPVMQADPTSQRFNQDLNFYLRAGLVAFGVGSRGGSNGNNWPKESAELDSVMSWYRRAAQALRSQDLLKLAYVYTYDEPSPGDPHVSQVMEAIHWADPQLHNLLVMDQAPDPVHHAAWLKDADILCLRISSYDVEQAKQFTQLGKEMWLYVSSPAHPFPALVIDYPAISHRIIPWMCWKYGVKGFLYWCVNFWDGDPFENPANYTKDQNGNGSLYYPTAEGPVPSIRMEVLRDGMEDYEYLYLLNELVNQAKNRPGFDAALIADAEKLTAVDPGLVSSLRGFSKDAGTLLSLRDSIAEMIERFTAQLSAAAPAAAP